MRSQGWQQIVNGKEGLSLKDILKEKLTGLFAYVCLGLKPLGWENTGSLDESEAAEKTELVGASGPMYMLSQSALKSGVKTPVGSLAIEIGNTDRIYSVSGIVLKVLYTYCLIGSS